MRGAERRRYAGWSSGRGSGWPLRHAKDQCRPREVELLRGGGRRSESESRLYSDAQHTAQVIVDAHRGFVAEVVVLGHQAHIAAGHAGQPVAGAEAGTVLAVFT